MLTLHSLVNINNIIIILIILVYTNNIMVRLYNIGGILQYWWIHRKIKKTWLTCVDILSDIVYKPPAKKWFRKIGRSKEGPYRGFAYSSLPPVNPSRENGDKKDLKLSGKKYIFKKVYVALYPNHVGEGSFNPDWLSRSSPKFRTSPLLAWNPPYARSLLHHNSACLCSTFNLLLRWPWVCKIGFFFWKSYTLLNWIVSKLLNKKIPASSKHTSSPRHATPRHYYGILIQYIN